MRKKIPSRYKRGGTGLLPPNPEQWDYENNALDVRRDLDLDVDSQLKVRKAFACLIPTAKVRPHSDVPVCQKVIDRIGADLSGCWSGMALRLNGEVEVIFNDCHSDRRVRATLMEEFFHLRLNHPPSSIRLYQRDSGQRTFNSDIEEEAYHSGAAALVPYGALSHRVKAGSRVGEIADYFRVTHDLVWFRSKVTKLYSKLRKNRR